MTELPPPSLNNFEPFARMYPLKRLTSVISVTALVYMATHAISTVLEFGALDEAKDFAKDSSLKRPYLDAIQPSLSIGLIASVAELILLVGTLIWTYRVCSNLTSRGLIMRFSPVLCVFAWVLPPVLFVFPLLVLLDFATKTRNIRADQDNKLGSLVIQWFVLYGVIPLGSLLFNLTGGVNPSDQEQAKSLSDHLIPNTIASVSLIAAAFLWRQIVTAISLSAE